MKKQKKAPATDEQKKAAATTTAGSVEDWFLMSGWHLDDEQMGKLVFALEGAQAKDWWWLHHVIAMMVNNAQEGKGCNLAIHPDMVPALLRLQGAIGAACKVRKEGNQSRMALAT